MRIYHFTCLFLCLGAVALYLAYLPSLEEQGALYYQNGQYEKAATCFEKLYNQGDHSIAVLSPLIEIAKRLDNLEKAIALMEELAVQDPGNLQLRKDLGNLYSSRGQYRDYSRNLANIYHLEPSTDTLREQIQWARHFGESRKEKAFLAGLVASGKATREETITYSKQLILADQQEMALSALRKLPLDREILFLMSDILPPDSALKLLKDYPNLASQQEILDLDPNPFIYLSRLYKEESLDKELLPTLLTLAFAENDTPLMEKLIPQVDLRTLPPWIKMVLSLPNYDDQESLLAYRIYPPSRLSNQEKKRLAFLNNTKGHKKTAKRILQDITSWSTFSPEERLEITSFYISLGLEKEGFNQIENSTQDASWARLALANGKTDAVLKWFDGKSLKKPVLTNFFWMASDHENGHLKEVFAHALYQIDPSEEHTLWLANAYLKNEQPERAIPYLQKLKSDDDPEIADQIINILAEVAQAHPHYISDLKHSIKQRRSRFETSEQRERDFENMLDPQRVF